MRAHPENTEIDQHTIKLIIGVIALSLAALTSAFSETPLQSISASYHEDGWSRNIFVGSLFAISAFLMAYNGYSTFQMIISKVAAFSAMGVAMFPCQCGQYDEIIPYVHALSAAVMFLVLMIFCYTFFVRAYEKKHTLARFRAFVYALCGSIIFASIAIIAVDNLMGGIISSQVDRLTFFAEAAGLIAFGTAWLTASRSLPFITTREERLRLSPFSSSGTN